MTSVATAAYRRLLADEQFQDLVEAGVVGKGVEGDDELPWLFQGLDNDGRPFVDPEHTGKAAVVVASREPWTAGNAHNTAKFPVLQVLIYADSARKPDGSYAKRDAPDRCGDIYDVVDRVFHDPANRQHAWPGLFVISCVRSQALRISDVPGTQSLTVRGEARYDLSTD